MFVLEGARGGRVAGRGAGGRDTYLRNGKKSNLMLISESSYPWVTSGKK